MRLHSRGRKLRLRDQSVGTVLPSDKLGDSVPQIDNEVAIVIPHGLNSPTRTVKRLRAQMPTRTKVDSYKPNMARLSTIQQPRPGF